MSDYGTQTGVASNIDLGVDALRSAFDAPSPFTVGIEEEVMLLDLESLDLVPRNKDLLIELNGDLRFKPELPAAQVEITTEPTQSVPQAVKELEKARRDLSDAAQGRLRLATAGAHPFALTEGELTAFPSERYRHISNEYGYIARRQLVCSLQVHVAVGNSEQTLTVYNALRSYLPELAALAANAPFYLGEDTGLASIRPKICETLPRQGIPPELPDWEAFAEALRWGATAGTVAEPGLWWWELRPHPTFGTLEVRVPDAQTTLTDAAGVAAVIQALVTELAKRENSGDLPSMSVPTWRIEENRWSAARYGIEGTMADLETGRRESTRTRLYRLLERLEPTARELGSASLFQNARALVARNGAVRQRNVAGQIGMLGLASWLSDQFCEPVRWQADRADSPAARSVRC